MKILGQTRIWIVALALLLAVQLTAAKGSPHKVDVVLTDGTVIEVTDPAMLDALARASLEDYEAPVLQTVLFEPQGLGDGVEIIRYFFDSINDEYVPYDHLRYYPNPEVGPGYVYYQGPVYSSASAEGKWYRASANGSATISRILRTYRASQIESIALSGHEDAVTTLAWSPDGTALATSAGYWDSTDHAVRLWRADGELFQQITVGAPVASLDWSPDGTMLALGLYDETLEIWGMDGTRLQSMATEAGFPLNVDWSPDGTTLAVAVLAGTTRNTIQVWSLDGTLLHTLPTQYSGGKFLNVGWSPDGQYLVGGAIDYKAWRADGAQVATHEACEHCTPAWGFAWSPDSSKWAIGNESGQVWVYSSEGHSLAELRNEGNVDRLAWSPDSTMLAGGSSVWEWREGRFERRMGMSSSRSGLAWSPDGSFIATAAENQPTIRLWNTGGDFLAVLDEHTFHIESLAWSPDGRVLASASGDTTVRLWDTSGLTALTVIAPA